ncbi:MAG: acyltransferase family protein [Bacteroidales bacterium]|nr:acyltransferase family protein [Bacteroidales bacterium]
MEIKKRENIGWIDLLRVMACFLVVVSHCCDPFVGQFDSDRGAFLTGTLIGSAVRCCVPLFVMMIGVLLLPVTMDIRSFYKKRIGRIITPLVFWSIVLPVLFFIYVNYVVTTANPSIVYEDHTLTATLKKLYTFLFNFNFDTTVMWYLYMLIGLYLVMPVISVWLKQASKKDIKTVLYVWGISLLLPYVKMVAPVLGYTGNYGNMGILGVCDWNEYGTFYYFSGFIGYLILSYYLVKYPLQWSWKKTLSVSIPMFLAGYAITSGGFIITQEYFPGNYANLEIVWLFAGINVFMMTFPIFIIGQKLTVSSSPLLSLMAKLSFGIYLCHFLIVQMAYDFFSSFGLPAIVQIAAMAISSFIISFIVVRIMWQFKLTRRFIA